MPDIGSESRFLPTPPAFDSPLGGSRRNNAMPFGMEKLERWIFPTVKKFDDMFISFDTIHERDTHTDRHTDTT